MKWFFKYLAVTLIITLVGLTAYYAYEIFKARSYTKTVLTAHLSETDFPIRPDDLTERQLKILLLVEDPAFFEHGGVDLSTPGAGLTTITQALVKIHYFKNFKSGLAKIKQTLIAYFALDPLISKQDQLKLFINELGFGHGQKGLANAARYYFDKPFSDLNDDQYIALIAMLNSPMGFNIIDRPAASARRVAAIKRLVDHGYQPKGLCDMYYGPLDKDTLPYLAPMSYFESYYRDTTE